MTDRFRFSGLLLAGFLLMSAGCGGEDGDGDADVVQGLDCTEAVPHQVGAQCVECADDSHCPEGRLCSLDAHQCVCPESAPCFDGAECRECLKNADCQEGRLCDLKSYLCIELACDEALTNVFDGECEECVVDEHCPGDQVCNSHARVCQCPNPKHKFVDGKCVECTKSSECQPGYVCNKDTNLCELYASSCPDDKPFFLQGECVQCLVDSDCKGEGETCHLTKSMCMPPPLDCEGAVPYAYKGECVQCLGTQHCGEGLICKEVTLTCEEPVSTGECSPNGTGKTIGFQIGDFQVTDCDGTPVSLHEYCGQAKAVWLIMVAGWCGACDGYAPEANNIWLQHKDKGLQLLFILGEDPNSNKPNPGYCKQWAANHSVTAPVLVDTSWMTMAKKISPGGNSLPWDLLLDGDDMKFVWESVNYSSEALTQEINKLLND